MISPIARLRAWRDQREEDKLERIDAFWYAGYQAGYDEGFLEAIAERDDSQPDAS